MNHETDDRVSLIWEVSVDVTSLVIPITPTTASFSASPASADVSSGR
jgi:hypothetical protein